MTLTRPHQTYHNTYDYRKNTNSGNYARMLRINWYQALLSPSLAPPREPGYEAMGGGADAGFQERRWGLMLLCKAKEQQGDIMQDKQCLFFACREQAIS